MEKRRIVTVEIRKRAGGAVLEVRELGEFHAVWANGVSIGSDPRCSVALPDLPSVACRAIGDDHRRLAYLLPEGQDSSPSLDPPPPPAPHDPALRRVDSAEVPLGPYRLRFVTRDA